MYLYNWREYGQILQVIFRATGFFFFFNVNVQFHGPEHSPYSMLTNRLEQ